MNCTLHQSPWKVYEKMSCHCFRARQNIENRKCNSSKIVS